MNEHDIQNLIRIEFCKRIPDALLFRLNVGQAWTGSSTRINQDGSLTIFNPRPFNAGIPTGFSDLFGVLPGGKAIFIEVKSLRGKPSPAQTNFLSQAIKTGAIAGVARSIEDVINIISGG